ncbi:hypothetical protein BTUL_0010g00030 [Botrytis tulipae]|uniref:Uncharacterized protein n=1 Tax=Botrytis tulipae TaxID=87230 RepID=A0A4Z1F167_9HELO|nr:hypothetical protein BTUL_0010g00030 [Botrytis tulipae]
MLTGPVDYDYHSPTDFQVVGNSTLLAAGEHLVSRFRELRLEVVRSSEARVERWVVEMSRQDVQVLARGASEKGSNLVRSYERSSCIVKTHEIEH